jgi:1,4-dihydroxy-2-naphthoyl-CoA hydrolase
MNETLVKTLEIEVVETSKDRVVAKMPIQPKVHQPFGFLHGGASVALAETVASIGAYLNVAENGENAFGLEINANHIRPKRDGVVTATATPLHRGKTTHVWDIQITDEAGKLICVSRCTVAITKAGA